MSQRQETGIFAVQAKMPAFSNHNIIFFVQLDSTFTLNKIDDEKMKYTYLINIFDTGIHFCVSDLIFTPPTEKPFTTLKNKWLKIFENSISQNTKALL